jgi:hypothetical protein
LEEKVTADNLAENEIDYGNLIPSELSPRPVAAVLAEDHIMIIVVVVYNSYREVGVWRLKRPEFSR